MKPMRTESVHTRTAVGPSSAEMPPIENSTSAGTPAATKKAPIQPMSRRMFVLKRDFLYSSV